MLFQRNGRTDDDLLEIYKQLLYPRIIEEKMLKLLRQGRISKWFSGIGQEAISIGATMAMDADEYLFPMHRNLGVFTSRNVPLEKLFLQWQGKEAGFTKGRDRSFHFGSADHHICGMISHLGPQLSLASGVALAYKLDGLQKVSLAFTGDGGTSQGEFHEALNLASVWDLPVIFIIENNGYGLSTPVNEQYRAKHLADKGIGYGMKSLTIDGNNVLEVMDAVKTARSYCIKQKKPFLLECMTFRMRGHEEASGTKYVPQELFDEWAIKDPVQTFEDSLLENGVLTLERIKNIKETFKGSLVSDLESGLSAPDVISSSIKEEQDVFKAFSDNFEASTAPTEEMNLLEAIRDGLFESMNTHPNLVLMGQDIAAYGGVFKATEGFVEAFGNDKVRSTPLCESAVLGCAVGLSLQHKKSMVEMQFADFVTMGMTQIINNMAKLHYRWGQNVDTVVRMPTGGGVGAGPFHSQSTEAWFTHTAGLKVVYPSNPFDAKGLLIASINDPNPVMFFEHKALYRSISGDVPKGSYAIEIGKAKVVREGDEICIITYGLGVHWANEYAEQHPETSIHILDLRTLAPLDYDAIQEAVQKTNKVLVLHEDVLIGGIGGHIAAWIQENFFQELDAPVMRCASLDTPIPFAISLEENYMAKSRLSEKIRDLLNY